MVGVFVSFYFRPTLGGLYGPTEAKRKCPAVVSDVCHRLQALLPQNLNFSQNFIKSAKLNVGITASHGILVFYKGADKKPIKMEFPSTPNDELHIAAGTYVCGYCYGDHYTTVSRLLASVPKFAQVCPYMIIACGNCGWEMQNDLQCPRCECEQQGKLVPRHCDHFWDLATAHTSESCPNKGVTAFISGPRRPIIDEDLARIRSPSWEPSSP